MDLNILKQIIILKLTIWFYRRQWMRERGGRGREGFKCYTIVFHVCYEKLQLWITITDYTAWHDLG